MTKVEFNAPTIASLPKTDAELDKAFKSIKGRGNTLQMDVHKAACGVLHRMNELGNNDVRIVGKLMESLPASYRTNAMRDWFTAFGPVAWDKNKPVFARDKADKTIALTAALAEPFWLFSPEADYKPLDVDKALYALIKKLTADQTKSGAHHGKALAVLETLRTDLKLPPTVPVEEPPKVEDVLAQ